MAGSACRALLVDMDDTILAYSAGAQEDCRRLCAALEPELGLPAGSLFPQVERTRNWFWSDAQRHRFWRLDMAGAWAEVIRLAADALGRQAGPLAHSAAAAFLAQRDAALRPFPGALDTLARWRAAGLRLALLTNGAAVPQRAKVERFGLAPFFDCVLIEGECGVGKPDPAIYRLALAALGVEPGETWMVGDNLEWEVAAPQRLGMRGYWVDVRGQGLPAGCPVLPDGIIRHLGELL